MNAGVVQNTLYAIDLRYNTIDKHWAYTMYILESLEFDGPALHSHTMVEMNVKSQLGTALVLFGGFWNQDIARNNPTPTGSLWYVNTVYVKATTRNLVWKGPLTDVIKQPAPRFGHSAIFNEATSELWSVGGSGVSKDLRVMAVENAFQPSTWSWQSGPSLDIGSFHHTLTPLRIPDSNDKFILVKYGGQANSTHYHKTLEYIAFSIDGQRVPLNYTDNTDNTNEGGPKPGGMPVETIIIIGASVGGSVLLMAGLAFGAHRYRRRILKPKTGSSRRLSRIEAAEGNASSLPPPAAPLRPQAKPPRVAGIRPQKEVKLDRGKTSDYNLNRTPSSEGLINHGGAALNHKLNRAPSSEAQLNRGKTSDNDYAQRASPSEAHHHRDKVSDYNLLRASPAQNPYSPVVEVIPMPQRHAGVHEDHPNVSPIPIHRMPPPADAQLLHGPALRPAPFRAQNSDPQLAVAALSSTPPAPPRKPQFFGSDKPLGQQQFAEAMMMTPAYVRLPYGNGGQSSSHNGQPLPQNGGHSSSHNSGGNGVVRERSRSQSRRDAAQAIPASSPAQVQRSQQPLLPQTKQTPAAGAAAALSSPTPTPPPPSNGQRRHKKLIISDVYTL